MNTNLQKLEWFGRIALAVVFIWFGVLKLFGVSPASELVTDLLSVTLSFIPADGFIVFLGVWEVSIGVLFLLPKLTKWAFGLLAVQMFTTFGPLLLLPLVSWQSFGVPTLEGQYILKNVVLVALGYSVYGLDKGA